MQDSAHGKFLVYFRCNMHTHEVLNPRAWFRRQCFRRSRSYELHLQSSSWITEAWAACTFQFMIARVSKACTCSGGDATLPYRCLKCQGSCDESSPSILQGILDRSLKSDPNWACSPYIHPSNQAGPTFGPTKPLECFTLQEMGTPSLSNPVHPCRSLVTYALQAPHAGPHHAGATCAPGRWKTPRSSKNGQTCP